nr:hypothetical protein [Tanacetum cinerariifolium]
MARLQFCDYHNIIAILEKSEHNVDFHPIVDFVEIETTKEGTKILATVDGILRTVTESSLRRNIKLQGEGSGTPSEPHHTPSPEAHPTSLTTHSSPTLPPVTTASIPTVTPSETTPIRQYTRRARIAQSSALPPVADEPASPLIDVSEGEACPTDSGLGADQDRETIAKTSTLPHDSAPRVTSPAAAKGKLISKFETQELEINRLKARVKLLKDREGVATKGSRDDALIKERNLDKEEAVAERVSDDTKEMAIVLTSIDAATVLVSGAAEVPTGSGSIPTAGSPAAEKKRKEIMVESETLKKKKIQEQMARQLKEEMERDAQRMNEQIARDAEIARIHAEKELQIMIDGLDKSNETVAKYLQEYHRFATELPLERRIKLISDLVKYQENYAKVYKFQTQQRKPWFKNQKRDYYMAVIKSNLGWKVKDFRGMTFEEIEAKFTTVWMQLEYFILMGSKEEAKRLKRKGLSLEQECVKKLKTSEVAEETKSPDEDPKEKVKEMMQLVPIEEVYVEALQVKHPIIDWKVYIEGQRSYWKIIRLGGSSASYQFFVDLLKHMDREDLNQLWALVKESLSNMQPISDKEIELWVELKRLYEPDDEDQLSTHTQNLMHALVEWKLYDMCGVHQVTSKDKEIIILVEKDYPLRKGLTIVMICYKLQVENYSQMANDLILKIYKIANCPSQQVIEFPLAEEVPTASEESSHCQKKRDATAKRIAMLSKSQGITVSQRHIYAVQRRVTPCAIKGVLRHISDSNYDQLYAYLKQHEAHANENKMMLDRFTQHTVDPLSLMPNVLHQQPYLQSSTTPPSTYVPPHLADNAHIDSGLSLTDNLIENLTNTIALLTQSYKTFLLQTNNQLRTSLNTRNQATVQYGRVVVLNVQGQHNKGQGTNPRGGGAAGYGGAQNRVRNANPYDCDVFDSNVDEAPMAQTMFMGNLSSADGVYDEVDLSYDSGILSEVHDHDHYQDAICEHHEEHEMHDNVQLNYVVDSHADYTSDSIMIVYDQYEQVKLYERLAMFELTEREQKINEQLRIVITDCNFKEETLKKELHSVKLQLVSTINHNKLMIEEVKSLKKDFKQKENKYLKDFLDMKSLKEKAKDRLFKQDQSLQIVHMLCRPKPYYNELNKVAIGYKNLSCLTRAKQVQPALYNGVNRCTDASGSQPRSNTKKNRISSAKGVNKIKVEEHPRTNKSHLRTTNHVDSSSRSKTKILENYNQQLILEYSLVMHQAGKISSGLVPNSVLAAPYVPPTNKDLEILFQPMFDEYLEPSHVERPVSLTLSVQVRVNLADTPSSTTIDQDAPSPSISPSSLALQSPSLHQGVATESTLMKDNHVAPVDNNPF